MKYADIKTKKDKVQHIRTMLGTNLNWASKVQYAFLKTKLLMNKM